MATHPSGPTGGRFARLRAAGPTLAALALAAVTALAPLSASPALASGGSCKGGATFPNSLAIADNGWSIQVTARVSAMIPVAKEVDAEVRVHRPMWADDVAASRTATFVPLGTYELDTVVSKSDLGLTDPGDSALVHVLFRIPGEPDKETCRVRVTY